MFSQHNVVCGIGHDHADTVGCILERCAIRSLGFDVAPFAVSAAPGSGEGGG